jgi:hypothetical protein
MMNRVAVGMVGAVLASLAVEAAEPLKSMPSPAQEAAEAEVRRMDMDRDGKLSAAEHANGTKRMFGKMDMDGNGSVTAAEMDAAQAAVAPGTAPSAMSSQDKIKVIDTNKDGTLSAEEHAAGSRSMFEKMDRDKDGFLTAAEVQRGHETLLKAKKN